MSSDTIKQRTKTLPFEGHPIVVRRMLHKPHRECLKLLARAIAERRDLFQPAGADGLEINLTSLFSRLPDLVESVDGLAEAIVTGSTDDTAKLDQLDLVEWNETLAVALQLSFGEDLKNSFAGIGEALKPLLAELTMKTSSGAAPTPV